MRSHRIRPPAAFIVALVASALLGAAASPRFAHATSALYVSDDEQARLSSAVAVVTVGTAKQGVHPQWGRPITRTELKIDELLYGSAPAAVVIEQFGGTVDGKTLRMPGDARFEPGERCVVFLRQQDGQWFLTAMEQSKYRIVRQGRLDVLERSLGDGIFVRGGDGHLLPYEERLPKPVYLLSDLRAALARVARAPAGGSEGGGR
jgi:hypothetical protein